MKKSCEYCCSYGVVVFDQHWLCRDCVKALKFEQRVAKELLGQLDLFPVKSVVQKGVSAPARTP